MEISIALSFYFIKLGVDVIPRPIDLVPSIVFMNAKAGHTRASRSYLVQRRDIKAYIGKLTRELPCTCSFTGRLLFTRPHDFNKGTCPPKGDFLNASSSIFAVDTLNTVVRAFPLH